MTVDQALAFAVSAATLRLFAFGPMRRDLVALTALAAAALLVLAPTETIFAGFGHPAAFTVAAVLILSQMLNRSGGVGFAARLDANPDPFLTAVAIGASCAFLTPFGHRCDTPAMGPGGYRFTDYWPMGLPLEALSVAVAAPSLLVVWGV